MSTPISPQALAQLRAVVRAMHDRKGQGVPIGEMVRLAQTFDSSSALTIDFDASLELGAPMVVVRPRGERVALTILNVLSPREREVAHFICVGLTNREIAEELCISIGTVKDHVHHILRKTGLRGRAAIIAALRSEA